MNTDTAKFYSDFSGLTALKAQARNDQGQAVEEVAQQFESLFIQMMLKSMRDASFGGGLMDGKQMETYQDMYDKQISLHLSENGGIGLASSIVGQLRQGESAETGADGSEKGFDISSYFSKPIDTKQSVPTFDSNNLTEQDIKSADEFLDLLWPAAKTAAKELGVPVESLLSQAALETGWGQHVIQKTNGQSSHNLFGIKADHRWQGEVVSVETTEYRNGKPLKVQADFRAYDSWQQSFDDYVQFIKQGDRYQQAVAKAAEPAAYFNELQKAGYATDPAYADKIQRIMDGIKSQQAQLGDEHRAGVL